MILHLFVLALANITYAQLQKPLLAENACDLFQSWNQPTHLDTFVHYTLDGEEKSVSLSSKCINRVEDALSIYQYLFLEHNAHLLTISRRTEFEFHL
jgi:hypothetical protein